VKLVDWLISLLVGFAFKNANPSAEELARQRREEHFSFPISSNKTPFQLFGKKQKRNFLNREPA
jgi:hypothetical protein